MENIIVYCPKCGMIHRIQFLDNERFDVDFMCQCGEIIKVESDKESEKLMTNNLTLIESEVLDELLEKAILYDILSEENQLYYETDWNEINKRITARKANFLSKYIDVPIDLNETLADKLDELGYE
jgi:hypothetical protein